jgi:hypothetical protein
MHLVEVVEQASSPWQLPTQSHPQLRYQYLLALVVLQMGAEVEHAPRADQTLGSEAHQVLSPMEAALVPLMVKLLLRVVAAAEVRAKQFLKETLAPLP